MNNFLFLTTIILAYLVGSVPNAILICKIFKFPDPRNYGSKNPGATNTLRIAGINSAITVLLLDILKGALPIWTGYYLKISSTYLGTVAIFSCIGHMYPIFFRFYGGGKGVATAFGALTAINIHFSIIMIISWIIMILCFRYVSLASIITAIIIPLYTWYCYFQYFIPITIISFLIIIRHINNIKRLWSHQEQKIGNNH